MKSLIKSSSRRRGSSKGLNSLVSRLRGNDETVVVQRLQLAALMTSIFLVTLYSRPTRNGHCA